MCGIVGFLAKRPVGRPVGRVLLEMLSALSCRGPDSTGVALYAPPQEGWVLQVKLPEHGCRDEAVRGIVGAAAQLARVLRYEAAGAYLRLEVAPSADASALEEAILAGVPGCEVVSLGHSLEVLKQVGSPARLERDYSISTREATHGIGHTRLSTESRVDLSHSQPFWAHGLPDLATVHNGHITNYHKLRRRYEQAGCRFYTDNDSEILGVYLRDRIVRGLSLEDALRSSLDDLDGSYSFLAATPTTLAYVRDRFGFKPLVLAETDDFVALATEEIALRRALGSGFSAREPAPGSLGLWTAGSAALALQS